MFHVVAAANRVPDRSHLKEVPPPPPKKMEIRGRETGTIRGSKTSQPQRH